MNLIFDTETTGLPEKHFNWRVDYKLYPRILTIAWKVRSQVKHFMIDQEGREVPKGATAVNGITTKMANDKKTVKPLSFVLGMFIEDAFTAGNIIGHNVHFDTSMVQAETLRLYGPKHELSRIVEESLHKDKRICTLQWGKKLFKGKWPKLIELYAFLFPGEIFPAHDAVSDMLACERCFNEMIKRGIV